MGQHPLADQWCQAVIEEDIQKILSLYENDALLKPTLSPEIRSGRKAIRNYFTGDEEHIGFLARQIKKISYQVKQELYLDHALILMGTYQFTCPQEIVKAHFTFIIKESAEGFKILAHHSSLY